MDQARLRSKAFSVAPPLYMRLYNKARFVPRRAYWEALTAYDIARFRANGSPSRRPGLIIIGAPKCGTSWLRVALAEHPDIIMVQQEIEYFSHHLARRLDWYLDHFADQSPALDQRNASYRKPYADCVIGEKSASYVSLSKRRIRMVHKLQPNARLILVMRDPVRRHWAHAKQYFYKKWRLAATDVPEAELNALFLRTRKLGEYSRIIADWTEVFGCDSLLTFFQENLLENPVQSLEESLDHIGVSKSYDRGRMSYLFKQVNSGPQIPMAPRAAVFLDEMFAPEYDRLRELLGERVAVWS